MNLPLASGTAGLEKFEQLKSWLRTSGGVVIGFSGGVDSTFLAYAAHCLKDEIPVLLVTATSETYDLSECDRAKKTATELNLPHLVFNTSELGIPGFRQNDRDRCYYCKRELFSKLIEIARQRGIKAVCDASHADDTRDYRPGFRARDELGVKSPLQELGFTKDEIRELSAHFRLPDPDRPATVCYSSRFPYGEEITEEKIAMVAQGEAFLRGMFPNRNIRVRYHGEIARIEVDAALLEKVAAHRDAIVPVFKRNGFRFVTIDLEGYRQGCFN